MDNNMPMVGDELNILERQVETTIQEWLAQLINSYCQGEDDPSDNDIQEPGTPGNDDDYDDDDDDEMDNEWLLETPFQNNHDSSGGEEMGGLEEDSNSVPRNRWVLEDLFRDNNDSSDSEDTHMLEDLSSSLDSSENTLNDSFDSTDSQDSSMLEDQSSSAEAWLLEASFLNDNNLSDWDDFDMTDDEWLFRNSFQEDDDSSILDSDLSDNDEIESEARSSISNFVENTVHLYLDEEFTSHFRLQRQTVNNLIEIFQQTSHLIDNDLHHNPITHERAFLMTLWYLANTETFHEIANRFNFTARCAYKVLVQTLEFLCSLTGEYLRWPTQTIEKEEISRRFARGRNIRGIMGVIDACHIPIRRPAENERQFLNSNDFHSVILQGVVTSKKLFTDVFIGQPGCFTKIRALRESPLYAELGENPQFSDGYFLLGDSFYTHHRWLVPPFRDNGHLTQQQQEFNIIHSSSHIKAKQAFRLLRDKFLKISHLDNFRLEILVKCIMASCVLHNICILSNNEESTLDNDDDDDYDDDDVDGLFNHDNLLILDRRQQVFNEIFNINKPEE